MLVFMFLSAIVAANLSVAYFGPAVAPISAFVLIGCDLVSRDALHEQWRGRHLWLRMALLIASGSILSYLLNPASARIALASCVAFGAASAVDAVTYHLLRDRPWFVRSNGSNVPSAIVDSVLFVGIAFGVFLPSVIVLQILAKVVGGLLWSMVLRRREAVTFVPSRERQ